MATLVRKADLKLVVSLQEGSETRHACPVFRSLLTKR